MKKQTMITDAELIDALAVDAAMALPRDVSEATRQSVRRETQVATGGWGRSVASLERLGPMLGGSPRRLAAGTMAVLVVAGGLSVGLLTAPASVLTGFDRGSIVGPEGLIAPPPRTFAVAADGSGDYRTIGEAVATVTDGDTIVVGPGTYTESFVVADDITLRGSDRDSVIIEAPEDGPVSRTGRIKGEQEPYAVLVSHSDARISGLTFRGSDSRVHVAGGAPTLSDLAFVAVGQPSPGEAGPPTVPGAVYIGFGSEASLSDSFFERGGGVFVLDGAEPRIEGNELQDGPNVVGMFGDAAVIRGNVIDAPVGHGIILEGTANPLIEGNTVSHSRGVGIAVGAHAIANGAIPHIRDNLLRANAIGIATALLAEPLIEANRFEANDIGISVARSDALIRSNTFEGNKTGMAIRSGAPEIVDNTVTGGETGVILLNRRAAPRLVGNTVCGNQANLVLDGSANVPVIEGGRICENTAVAGADG